MDRPGIAKYKGELKDNKPHGMGEITYTDGSSYVGEFVEGRICGKGVITFANGNKYEGEMKDDKRHGHGVFTWADGERYEGNFENDMRNGFGVYYYSNKERYEGEFFCGMKHGKGKFWFNSKHNPNLQDVYEGDFKNGTRSGHGELRFANGNHYVGRFENDKRNGYGIFRWASGNRYEGDFVDDRRTGRGKYTWLSGGVYVGDFEKDRRSGTGDYTYPDGSRYQGFFKDGVFDGLGCYLNRNAWKFEGEFVRYKRDGVGLATAPDSDRKYMETWSDGRLVDREEIIEDPEARHAKMIYETYELRNKLGSGSYGEIFKCIHKESGMEYAIKLERADRKKLAMEIDLLQSLKGSRYVCKLHDHGNNCAFEWMVMDLLGANLNDLRKVQPNTQFSAATSASLGMQMLASIRDLHEAGFVHRDIKPSNFVMGKGEKRNNLYIIDFGLARRYMMEQGTIIPPRKKAGWNGTQRYASIGTHQRKELGRHDDLWSLLYVLVQFIRGHLPWCKTRGKDAIGAMKVKYNNEKLVKGLPPEIGKFMEHIQTLGYYQAPNYEYLNQLLLTLYNRETNGQPHIYEWLR